MKLPFIWKINLDLNIFKIKNLNYYNKDKKNLIDNKEYFSTYEEAFNFRREILNASSDGDWKASTMYDFKIKKNIDRIVKCYEYNIFQYEHNFNGIKFNLGVLIFNQETNEFLFKSIEKKYFNKLITIFPDLKHTIGYINSLKVAIKKIKNVVELKELIIDYGSNYPSATSFLFKKSNSFLEYSKKGKEIKIKTTFNKLYQDKIISIFKEKNNEV